MSFFYFSFLSSLELVPKFAQLIIILASFLYFYSYKLEVRYLLVFIFTSFYFVFNGIYAFNLILFVVAFMTAGRIRFSQLSYFIVLFSFFLSLFSFIYFYSGFNFLYSPIYYSHYFLSGFHRLLGLDGSPAIISFLAGLCVLLIYYFWNLSFFKYLILSFFLLIVFLTASRTALIGLILALTFSLLPRVLFSLVTVLTILIPLMFSAAYFFIDDINILLLIEDFTSNRIVNWANLVHYFFNQDFLSIMFGIGKPEVIVDPYTLYSISGDYNYRFVTYAESSWLKLFVYHGFFVYFLFLIVLLFRSYFIISHKFKAVLFYIIFSGVFYDGVISVHYFFVTFLLAVILIGKSSNKIFKNRG